MNIVLLKKNIKRHHILAAQTHFYNPNHTFQYKQMYTGRGMYLSNKPKYFLNKNDNSYRINIQVSYWAMTLVLVGRMSRFTFPPSSVFKNAISSKMSTSVVLVKTHIHLQNRMHIHQYTLSQDSKNHLVNEHFFCARGICEVFKFYHIIHIHLKKNMYYFKFMHLHVNVVAGCLQLPSS